MKKQLFAFSLIACAVSVTIPTQAFAVTLYAAGSLRGALSEVANSFTQEFDIPVTTEFASSGSLKNRLLAGEKADVFASADLGNALALYQNNISGEVKKFATNPIYAIATPEVSLTKENLLDKFLNPDIKLGIAQPVSDPLGDYGIEVFRKAEQIRPGSFTQLNAKAVILSGTLPPDRNSPGGSIVYYLQDINKADIYLVYYTSALSAQQISPSLEIVELPDSLKVKADYGLTVLKDASPEGSKLANYILSQTGQKILAKYGFSSPRSVPEPQGVGGILLAFCIACVLQRLITKRQKFKVSDRNLNS
ncbi:substrate-binding domain-containing protein [Nostocaceae cyanobacterium CENA369]|uniref:Substrate-binding domain-containing protein n=1 Tax=Dendronalium phyllosphericum CENA369 TaxID=1725256 RepID=A0A8J7I5Z2_9NOST|nr:substrate-binding domain-containing protein [Dendronalium phyllosphericum]MBH8576586.1 substrate-binding domain-containing protein [Dendronalium phyllosphericum CENA369]